jgi:hypothetical protein
MSTASNPSDFLPNQNVSAEPPAMGERRARWGYGYQDRVATVQILELLRADLRDGTDHFQGVRLADIEAGRADDFVLICDIRVQGNSIKWSGSAEPMNWGELIGANGLIRELADGYRRLAAAHAGKAIAVQLQTNRPAATTTHPSQLIDECSVSDFFARFFRLGPTTPEPGFLSDIWRRIQAHTQLPEDEFAQFAASFQVRFSVPQPPSAEAEAEDQRNYLRQFESLHRAIATWITNHPDRNFIDRTVLLDAIGIAAYRTGLEQHFPAPEIPYERNVASAQRIKDAINSVSGGYLAITGPAGVGKSTLVQDVLSEYPLFIPYYAFLPDGIGNPRDRGEALTFFQDVVTRLDRFFDGRLSLGISDLSQGRDALRQHMRRAHRLFEQNGSKTILLIDGLDHVQREPGLDHPLLLQLPTPAEVPEGFVIILSSQPQALLPGTIERHVAAEVAPSSPRCIAIESLSRDEIHAIIRQADSRLSFEGRDALFAACSGNPLVLTYLLRFIEQRPDMQTREAIAAAGSYSGNMDRYYQDALAESLVREDHRALLGLLSRAVVPVPMNWLREWPEWSTFEQLYQSTLQPFLRVEGSNLYFIHNSLVAFLKNESRSSVPGVDLEREERRSYSLLADRCGNPECADPVGRGKAFYLLRAERYQELLAFLSTAWLRRGVQAFVPFAEIRPIVLHGIAAAWRLDNFAEVLRLILAEFEVGERASRISAEDLASKLLRLGRPELAVTQIRSAGRILVEDKHALQASADICRYALEHSDASLVRQARVVYLQSKPISVLYRAEPIGVQERHQAMEALQEWSEVAPLFESPDVVSAQIMKLQLARPTYPGEPEPESIKAQLLYQAVDVTLDEGRTRTECLPFLIALARLRKWPLYFAAILRTYMNAPSAVDLRRLERLYAHLSGWPDLDLQFAEVLLAAGESGKARAICSRLSHIRIDDYQSQRHFGLTDISFTVRLHRLQVYLGMEVGPVPQVDDERSESVGRIEAVARKLGELLAAVRLGQVIPDIRGTFRSLLLFHNNRIRFVIRRGIDSYRLVRSRDAIYRRVAELASLVGSAGIEALKDEFAEILAGPASDQFNATQRRFFALFFFENNVMDRSAAATLGLSDLRGLNADDPRERQEACLDNAVFLSRIGDQVGSEEWFRRAGAVTAGAGNHKDYHMSQLAEWLTSSCGPSLDGRRIRVLEKFVRSLEVSGGDGAGRATAKMLQFLVRADAGRASKLAIELIDREMLDVEDTVTSLMLGAVSSGASTDLLSAVYCSLLTLISTGDSSELASAIVKALPVSSRSTRTRQLMESVRTNAPPEYRMGVARALRDILLEDGESAADVSSGLQPGHDDSSMKSSLYELADGRRLSAKEVSVRLSDPSRRDLWNPNPEANSEFSWWGAIAMAEIEDLDHADSLLAAFALPDYENVRVLAWKSRIARKQGDFASARRLAEQVLTSAEDASWFTWLDGAKLRVAYAALMEFDGAATLEAARERFGRDLSAGKLWDRMLLDDTPEIFRFLEIEWPGEAVLDVIEDYIDTVLSVSREVGPMRALLEDATACDAGAALLRFVIYLLAFPVVDIGVAARSALAEFVKQSPRGIRALLAESAHCDPAQLECLLAAIDTGLDSQHPDQLNPLPEILNLNVHPSAGVRAIARRICERFGWYWQEVNDRPFDNPIVLPGAGDADDDVQYLLASRRLRNMVLELNRRVIRSLSRTDADAEEVASEMLQQYWKIESSYLWKDEKRLSVWIKQLRARSWLNPQAIVVREAGMRTLGTRALSGRAPVGAERAYDALYPVYDPKLEPFKVMERPGELRAFDWSISNQDRNTWRSGEGGDRWSSYPTEIGGLRLIGERTFLVRPEWEWPPEERRRGILAQINDPTAVRGFLSTNRELTYEMYLAGIGQEDEQLIISNDERQLVGPAYRWIAFNASIARGLGWNPAEARPFEWRSAADALMVKSVFWRDGWIGIEPPRMESLGEGWYVVATAEAIKAIRSRYPEASLHLWVERHSQGDHPYHQMWHLVSALV